MNDVVRKEEQADSPRNPGQAHGRDAIRDHIALLAEQARREIFVFAPRYERHLFNTARLNQALLRLVGRHRHNGARMLVEDADQLRRENDRLMELARRCSDFIHIHEVAEEHRGMRDLFVVADHSGYLYQENNEAAAVVNLSGKTETSTALVNRFEELWAHSTPLTGRFGIGR